MSQSLCPSITHTYETPAIPEADGIWGSSTQEPQPRWWVLSIERHPPPFFHISLQREPVNGYRWGTRDLCCPGLVQLGEGGTWRRPDAHGCSLEQADGGSEIDLFHVASVQRGLCSAALAIWVSIFYSSAAVEGFFLSLVFRFLPNSARDALALLLQQASEQEGDGGARLRAPHFSCKLLHNPSFFGGFCKLQSASPSLSRMLAETDSGSAMTSQAAGARVPKHKDPFVADSVASIKT